MSSWAKSKFFRASSEKKPRGVAAAGSRNDSRWLLMGCYIDTEDHSNSFGDPCVASLLGFTSFFTRWNFDWRLPPSQRWHTVGMLAFNRLWRGVEDVAPYKCCFPCTTLGLSLIWSTNSSKTQRESFLVGGDVLDAPQKTKDDIQWVCLMVFF